MSFHRTIIRDLRVTGANYKGPIAMTYVFRSTINCHNCESKVAPFLDQEEGIDQWEVDLEHPDRFLTVRTETLDEDDIVLLVRKAGYRLELVRRDG